MLRFFTIVLLLPLVSIAQDSAENKTNSNPIEVISYTQGNNTIEEYRIRGFLYSVKVIPKEGKPYYLVNTNGNQQVFRANHPQTKAPSWTLFSW